MRQHIYFEGYSQWFNGLLKEIVLAMRGRILVGRNIRRIRVAKGIAQERLAFDAGVDRSYLGGMERGEQNPTVDVLERVATTLRVPLQDLFTELTEDGDLRSLPRGRKPHTR